MKKKIIFEVGHMVQHVCVCVWKQVTSIKHGWTRNKSTLVTPTGTSVILVLTMIEGWWGTVRTRLATSSPICHNVYRYLGVNGYFSSAPSCTSYFSFLVISNKISCNELHWLGKREREGGDAFDHLFAHSLLFPPLPEIASKGERDHMRQPVQASPSWRKVRRNTTSHKMV